MADCAQAMKSSYAKILIKMREAADQDRLNNADRIAAYNECLKIINEELLNFIEETGK